MDIRITELRPLTDGATRVEFVCVDDASGNQAAISVDVSTDFQVQGYGQLALEAHQALYEQFRRFEAEILRLLQCWK